ncbi:Thiamin pyrophosphokinase [Giardia duodenalis assemblage B]|uniref:Thiamin pyrophosphokinase n=1 Tax=Giardia duodenalis assemblage B TaxID=1394984 RepID=A0A132NWM3_GIAIN|nr:Thiamin pyrophosphokinase [Giardia intestinalis assemblage B]
MDARYDLRYLDGMHATRAGSLPESANLGEYHVILLNYLWPSWWQVAIAEAKTVILADGAAARLASVVAGETLNECKRYEGSLTELQATADTTQRLLSSAAGTNKFVSVGDYDSMTPRALEFLDTYGIARNHVPDQDSTDGAKALDLLLTLLSANRSSYMQTVPHVLFLGAFGGRLDHCLCHISLLHKYSTKCAIHLHGDGNVALLIPPTYDSLQREPSFITLSLPELSNIEAVGVIAHNGPCRVWSGGLKWDMEGLLLGYEAMQSGCNIPLSTRIRISSDGFVIFILTYNS